MDKIRALGKLKSLADARPKIVSSGPCQEIVMDPPSLDALPIMTCWPQDGGPFITLPAVITRDPRTGDRNVGMYRVQKFDATTTAMHWQIHKDGAADWRGMGSAWTSRSHWASIRSPPTRPRRRCPSTSTSS